VADENFNFELGNVVFNISKLTLNAFLKFIENTPKLMLQF
jgi:hypothetical protein